MERVSGWYLRHVRYLLLAIGLVLAIGMNADVFYLWGRIAADSALRDSLVRSAATAVAARPADALTPGENPASNKVVGGASENAAAAQASATAQLLNSLNLPMGWPACNLSKPDPDPRFLNACNPSAPWDWRFVARAVLGWLMMAFAVSLGAPFWFDLLQRLLQLRAAGVKPDDAGMSATKPDAAKSSAALSGPSPTSPTAPAETPRNDFERMQLSVHDFRLIQARLGASQTGQPDAATRSAIAHFQRNAGLPADGTLTATLTRSILHRS
jgi:peptidoglycan hydrolase-like protein with peptidoglycan-binding domain